MKDEIKEILDKMERLIVYGQYNAYYDLEKQLLDNINNLQEERYKYKNVIDKIKEIFKDYGDSENIVGYSMYNITGEDLLIIKELLEEVENV